MRKGFLIIGLLFAIDGVYAQQAGTCTVGEAEAFLDVGNVRARLMNTGGLFWNGSPNVYEVPKGDGVNALYYANFWIAGRVQDSLRIAASQYGPYEFWPGPIGSIEDPLYNCTKFDRLATIYRADIERYEASGSISPRLATWPWQWGASVLDGDGDPGNYNLAGGDRPELLGDQTVWWVMNDIGNEHLRSHGKPIGMEVHVLAFAFNTVGVVGNTTFYRYRLHYRGTEPLDSAYVGFFFDSDLGQFFDDYIGADTTLGMAYTYNGDNHDEEEYGNAPPALGASFLQGPLAMEDGRDNNRDGTVDEEGERLRVTSVTTHWGGGGLLGAPDRGPEYYRFMQGLWRDGSPIREGGYGADPVGKPTTFMFAGDPVAGAFWSEVNAHPDGLAMTPADRRMVMAAGPFQMEPGDVEEIVLAIVWSRGDSNLDSVRKLREDMAYIQSITPDLMASRSAVSKSRWGDRFALGYHKAYPNPFVEATTIRYSLEHTAHVRLTIFDMLGREVATLVDKTQEAGWHEAVFNAEGLASGTYLYRLQIGQHVATETMVVL